MNLSKLLQGLFRDPPALFAIEVGRSFVAGVRRDPKTFEAVARAYCTLDSNVVEPSSRKPNVHQPEILAQAIHKIWTELGPARSPDAALILPDTSSRLTVLDFDYLPNDEKQRLQLIRLRLKKAVPFDVQNARIAYQAWKIDSGFAVLVAITPAEIIEQYEQALKSTGLQPGYVSLSAVVALNLLPDSEMNLFAKLSEDCLTMIACDVQAVRMVRSVELTPNARKNIVDSPDLLFDEITEDLYPTLVFIADNFQRPVKKLILGGFDSLIERALNRFPSEFNCEVEPLKDIIGIVGERDVGIQGGLNQN